MKTTILLFSLCINIFAQINPSEFPKIGFGDLYMLAAMSGNTNNPNYTNNKFYYPKLKELGLTHIAAWADPIAVNPSYNDSLKILDRNFERRDYANDVTFSSFAYSFAIGNKEDIYPYEAGGQLISHIHLRYEGFGFGTSNLQSDFYSWWFITEGTIGNTNYFDPNGNRRVFFADKNNSADTLGGYLLKAKLNGLHTPYDNLVGRWLDVWTFWYKAAIQCRIDEEPELLPTDTVARVHIYEKRWMLQGENQANDQALPRFTNHTDQLIDSADFYFYITAGMFNGDNYKDITSPSFRKKFGYESDLYVDIQWLKKRNMYIDKIFVYNQFYDTLFIQPINVRDSIRNKIKQDFTRLPNTSNSLYAHLYLDEPFQLQNYAIGTVSQLAEEQLGYGKYINGAQIMYTRDQLELINTLRRPPYILSDYYPLKFEVDTFSSGANSLQTALDVLIDYSYYSAGGFDAHRGLKQMINWAHNFNQDHSNLSEHVPFYHTIQCQAEFYQLNATTTTINLRAPKYNEILAQGWLSLCYGAKGIMYYNIYSSAWLTGPYPRYIVYGLFDDTSNKYEGTLIQQDPDNLQVPNSRFYAVKKLNQQIDKISSALLQLVWTNGFSLHKENIVSSYINAVESFYHPPAGDPCQAIDNLCADESLSKYVELGLFKHKDHFTDNDLEYFILVNRRCLSSEGRYIKVHFNRSSSLYNNWKITEVGSDNYWIRSKQDTFSTFFEPGTGKLFKLEPVITSGGILFHDEAIPSNTTLNVNGNIVINSSATLTLGSGCNLQFNNNSTLQVNGNLIANGIASNKITFDFITPSNGNGIILSSDAVINISNAVIKNAHYGISIDRSEPTIQDCEFQNCIYGLFLNESNYEITLYEGTRIANNKFSNNSVGINLNNSSPLVTGNEFTGSSTSIECFNGSNGYLGEYLEPGLNVFHDNLAADVYVNYSSPTLGLDLGGGEYIGGYNNFEDVQEYFVIAEYSNIEAGLNWWGESPPNENYFYTDNGYIELRPWLENSPNAPQQNFNNSVKSPTIFSATSPLTITVFDPTWNIRKKINYAERLIRQNEKVNARRILKDIVFEHPDSTLSFKAVNLFINTCRMNSERDTLKKFLKLASNIQNQKEIHRYVKLRLLELNRESYLSNIDGLISTNQNSEILELMYFSKFMHNYFNEKNYSAARVVMNKMVEKFPLSEMTKAVKQMMGESLGKNVGEKTATAFIPQKSMLVNYPNPFNPSTKIKFSVPTSPPTPLLVERGGSQMQSVSLKIYDVLGKEIATLVNEEKEPGVYEVEFPNVETLRATSLPSGVYFYQLRVSAPSAGSGQVFVETKKMILLR